MLSVNLGTGRRRRKLEKSFDATPLPGVAVRTSIFENDIRPYMGEGGGDELAGRFCDGRRCILPIVPYIKNSTVHEPAGQYIRIYDDVFYEILAKRSVA